MDEDELLWNAIKSFAHAGGLMFVCAWIGILMFPVQFPGGPNLIAATGGALLGLLIYWDRRTRKPPS